jgi:putative ABC transport system permease protein
MLLLMRSFMRLQQVESARDPETLIVANLPAPDSRFANADESRAFYHRILERTRSVPGVVSVALTSALPMQGWGYGMPLRIPSTAPGGAPTKGGAGFKMVSPAYFETVGLPIQRGRGLSPNDSSSSSPAIVVNQAFVARYFENGDPIGRHVLIERILTGRRQLGEEVPWEIVGVVANERVFSLSSPTARASTCRSSSHRYTASR